MIKRRFVCGGKGVEAVILCLRGFLNGDCTGGLEKTACAVDFTDY